MFYVYKIENLETGEYYIGKGRCLYNDDPDKQVYYGSGVWIRKLAKECAKLNKIPSSAKKRHFKNFSNIIKTILVSSVDENYIYEQEEFYIGDRYRTDPLCMNKCKGGLQTRYKGQKAKRDTEYKWNYDTRIHYFYNPSKNAREELTRNQFMKKYKLCNTHLGYVINGKLKSIEGWYCNNKNMTSSNFDLYIDNLIINGDGKIYHFKNLDSGMEEKTTVYGLYKKYNLSRSHTLSVVNGKRKSHKGWIVVSS